MPPLAMGRQSCRLWSQEILQVLADPNHVTELECHVLSFFCPVLSLFSLTCCVSTLRYSLAFTHTHAHTQACTHTVTQTHSFCTLVYTSAYLHLDACPHSQSHTHTHRRPHSSRRYIEKAASRMLCSCEGHSRF